MSDKEEIKDPEVKNDQTSEDIQNEADRNEENAPDIEQIQKELDDIKTQNLRLYADFENFRKRTAKERIELFGSANQELMGALLPVLDDFTRAIKAHEGEEVTEGVKLIYNKLENTLKNKGLKPMEDTTGKDFDVETMEAITRIPAPEDKQKGKVIDEIERGYMLGNKILRYAKVVVGE